MLPASDKKGITDILIICQLHSFVMRKQHVFNKFVLQALDMWAYKFDLTPNSELKPKLNKKGIASIHNIIQ